MHVQSSTSPPAIPIPMITTTSSSVPASAGTYMRGVSCGKGFGRGAKTPRLRERRRPHIRDHCVRDPIDAVSAPGGAVRIPGHPAEAVVDIDDAVPLGRAARHQQMAAV